MPAAAASLVPVREPPRGFLPALRFLGPGFILSAAVVGTGELIATTALGARTGFVLLWVILLSCGMKVAVQLEYGRYAIANGRPTLQGWNSGRGIALRRVRLPVYAALLFLLSAFVGAAGILGAAAQALHYVLPALPPAACAALLAAAAGLIVFRGRYNSVELLAGILNVALLSTILYCNFAIQGTRYAYGFRDLAAGLTLRLPPEGLTLALAVLGITGVGAGEIVMYPYWCVEKGYASYAGPADGSLEWAARARGWIRVMRIDALLSLSVYTVATCGFYLLGASVLRPQGELADGPGLILQLSAVFSSVLGPPSTAVFMTCALTVVFGALFANVAGLSRLWLDAFGIFRVLEPANPTHRRRALAALCCILPAAWWTVFVAVGKPLLLVIFMGMANAAFLLVVAWQALVFRYRHTDPRLTPSRAHDFFLWLSIVLIGLIACRMLISAAG